MANSRTEGNSIRIPGWLHRRLVEEQFKRYQSGERRPSLTDLIADAWLALEALDPAAAYAPVPEGETAPATGSPDVSLRRTPLDMDEAEYNMVKPMLEAGLDASVSDEDRLRVAEYERTHLT